MKEDIIIKHPNGYSGRLYGKSSMLIFSPEGKEVLHTGFRSINTQKELYDMLETYPEFMKLLSNIEITDDDAGDI